MSLLLDALKRAEQEKLAKLGERPEPEKVRRESVATAPSLELQPINPGASAPPPRSAAERSRGDAATAQTVFQAKEPAPGARSRKGLVVGIVLAVVVIVIAGAGIYVWQAVESFTPRLAASARPRTVQPIAPAPNEPAPRLETLMLAPPQQPTAAIQPPSVPEPRKEAPAARDPQELVAALLRDAAAPAAAHPLRLAPSVDKPRVPAEVAAGYEQLRNGDLAAAKRSYAAAIASDPANVDAQLGAATLEARSGNRMLAASHYRRALDLDPRNATAIAGLASIADYAQPEGLESQLRGEVSRNPESPQLRFTLGNLYASQSRWNEAQLEFFEAHRLDPANADILYNLAVSLDHIGQSRLAAEHYRRALDASREQATQFDPATVSRRLAQLKP